VNVDRYMADIVRDLGNRANLLSLECDEWRCTPGNLDAIEVALADLDLAATSFRNILIRNCRPVEVANATS